VLHDRADLRRLAVAEGVDVDLDRVLEEAVEEYDRRGLRPPGAPLAGTWPVEGGLGSGLPRRRVPP
jgi:hypothetical protein